MGYQKIPNLYKDQRVLEFRSVFATEKIHGSSSRVAYDGERLSFSSGGEKLERFMTCFDPEGLLDTFSERFGDTPAAIYGESYGGKMQGMRETYGDKVRFTAFEVKVGHSWLDVERADMVTAQLGLDFVPWVRLSIDSREEMLAALDEQRDAASIIAKRCGIEGYRKREGIVIRPPFEVKTNSGGRIVAKHKRDDFRETRTPRKVDGEKAKVLKEARAVAEEWCVAHRLEHIIGHLTKDGIEPGLEQTGAVVKAMVADIEVEGRGEFVNSREVRRAINGKTAKMFQERLKRRLRA